MEDDLDHQIARDANDPELQQLEATMRDALARRDAARKGSAAHRMALRQLEGLRWARQEAQGMLESLDPMAWGT